MLAVVVALGLAALADEDRVSFVVVRGAGAEACPDDDDLRARVRERIGSEPFAGEPALAARHLRVGVQRAGGARAAAALEARIALFGADGARLGRRTLRGDLDCAELADDLVLAIAIAIDPLLLVRKRPVERPRDDDAAPAPPQALPARAPAARVDTRAGGFDLPPPAAVDGRALVSVAAGVGVVAVPSVRSEVSFDYGALDLDAGVRFDLPARYPVAGGEVLIDLTLIALDAGPCVSLELDLTTLRGCGVVQGGALLAQGIGFATPRAATTPWLALGARGAVDVHLWPELALVFAGDLQAPLIRTRFVDDVSRQTLTQPALVTGTLGVGLALSLR